MREGCVFMILKSCKTCNAQGKFVKSDNTEYYICGNNLGHELFPPKVPNCNRCCEQYQVFQLKKRRLLIKLDLV